MKVKDEPWWSSTFAGGHEFGNFEAQWMRDGKNPSADAPFGKVSRFIERARFIR